MILIILNYITLALTFTVSKLLLAYAQPIFVVGLRMIIGGGLLLGYLRFTRKQPIAIAKSDHRLFVLVMLMHIYIPYVCENIALQRMNSSKMNMLYATTPFLAAFFGWLLGKERLSWRKTVAIIVGIIGMGPIMLQQGVWEGASLYRFSFAELLAVCAVCSATYAWFGVHTLMERGYEIMHINGASMLIGGVCALVTSLGVEGVALPPVVDFGSFLGWLMLLIMLANVIFYNLQGWLMKQYSISFITLAGFLSPLFGAFFGWVFLGEIITWHYYVSLVFIVAALRLYTYERHRR